ncbi:MAG TPA: hypothetical protein PLA12_04860 [Candidatus Hydrogenedens sp.]|nr:hypothetical protein [Candidatus Hydrogenedens sp.]
MRVKKGLTQYKLAGKDVFPYTKQSQIKNNVINKITLSNSRKNNKRDWDYI